MKEKTLSRKSFLMYALGLAVAGIVGKWEKVSRLFEKKSRGHLKEARFYRRANHLAG